MHWRQKFLHACIVHCLHVSVLIFVKMSPSNKDRCVIYGLISEKSKKCQRLLCRGTSWVQATIDLLCVCAKSCFVYVFINSDRNEILLFCMRVCV
jgi:hypothetical protein